MAALVRKNPGALAALGRKVAGERTLKVGFLQGGKYPDGTSVPSVAAWNEFGVPSNNQPPRPFFRIMIAEQSPKWGKMAAVLLQRNGGDIDATLDLMGQEIQGRIKESINALLTPKLADITIARKGHDKPLIDTALMVNSVNYEVVKE
jgi:hypothetical protein